jgi:hypothetical protein
MKWGGGWKGILIFNYLPCLLMEGSRSGSVQIITVPDPRGPNPYGSYGSRTVLLRKSCTVITPRMYNYKYTLYYNTYRDRAQVLIINSKKTYFFAEPKLRLEARLARDESRSPVITWSHTHYSVFMAIKKILVPNRDQQFSSSRKTNFLVDTQLTEGREISSLDMYE